MASKDKTTRNHPVDVFIPTPYQTAWYLSIHNY